MKNKTQKTCGLVKVTKLVYAKTKRDLTSPGGLRFFYVFISSSGTCHAPGALLRAGILATSKADLNNLW